MLGIGPSLGTPAAAGDTVAPAAAAAAAAVAEAAIAAAE
jgi:hypothetical protein